jgi:regulator of replication initiation timing
MNFQELHSLKADLEIVLEENRLLKFEHTSLQIDLESAKASIGRTSDVAI